MLGGCRLEDISDEDWDRNPREEVDLVFYSRALRGVIQRLATVVVNNASLTALISFKNMGTLAHTTAKAGIIGMTRAWDSRQFDFAWSDRDKPDARTAEGPRMGELHAR